MRRLALTAIVCAIELLGSRGSPCLAHAARPDLGKPAGKTKAPASKGQQSSRTRARSQSGRSSTAHKSKSARSHEVSSTVPDETTPRAARDPNEPREQRIAELRGRLEELVHDKPLGRTRLGVAVMDAEDGDVLYAHNAERSFNPASNTKILTTAAAMEQLGPDFRYRTVLLGPVPDEAGTVDGDVLLVGSGDPSLTTQGISELARALAAHGVVRIHGDLVVDGRYRDLQHPEEGRGSGALVLNRNGFVVRVRPTEPRRPAAVVIEPVAPECYTLQNHVVTTPQRRSRIRVTTSREAGRLVVTVQGRINPKDELKVKQHLGDGALLAAAVLRRALEDYGIELGGSIRSGDPSSPPGVARSILAEHASSPLAEICRVSNKDSNNFVADQIFKTLGRELFGGSASLRDGARAVGDWMVRMGFVPGTWKVVNGSGLTHENRVQPIGLVRLLRHLYVDLGLGPEFVTSLAVGGIDGTIRGRFGGGMVGRVRAKTGTLSNVSALSGYVGDKGEVLVFSILVDEFHHRRLEDIRYAQVRLVRELMNFLRADQTKTSAVRSGYGPPSQAAPDVPAEMQDDDDDQAADP